MHTSTHHEIKNIEKLWLVSFFLFYLYEFSLLVLCGPLVCEVDLLVIPLIHYFSFRRSNIYWFTFFTGCFVPADLIGLVLRVVFLRFDMIGLVSIALYAFFMVMSFRLLWGYARKKRLEYYSAVRYAWLFTLMIYKGLFKIVEIPNKIEKFQVFSAYELGQVIGMILGSILFVYIGYHFSVRKKSNLAIFIILLLTMLDLFKPVGWASFKFTLLGLFVAFCFSSYRLYKINKSEAEESDKNVNSVVPQASS